MVLRFFLVLVFCVLGAAAVLFLTDVLFAGAFTDDVDDWDWATADGKKPSQSRKKVPAKTATARRRTQTLPTA
jgi:hypothetical protein